MKKLCVQQAQIAVIFSSMGWVITFSFICRILFLLVELYLYAYFYENAVIYEIYFKNNMKYQCGQQIKQD